MIWSGRRQISVPKVYNDIVRQYPKISLSEERKLILKAQKGSKKCRDEIVLRHVSFLKFRIHKKAFPTLVRRFGEDLLSGGILILYKKIKTYNLNYRNKEGKLHPVKFISYIWKRIDGFIIDYLKKNNRYRSSYCTVLDRRLQSITY